MVPALLLIFLHMLQTGVSGNYHINAPPTFVSHDRRNLGSIPIPGFISIDCGRKLPEDTLYYTDEQTDIVYTSDVKLIDTGESRKVLMKSELNPNWKFLEYVRSFHSGTKNCYTLKPEQGRNKTYLVRATFMYGNYDAKNSPPIFDLYLGPNLWDTITFDNITHLVIKEIMHVFPMNFLDICLLNTNKGVPFISALELRYISNDNIYRLDSGSLETCVRYDYGRYITEPPVRYSEDAYDRIWYPMIWDSDLISINSLLTEDSLSDDAYKPPAMVMRTAITPSSLNDSISINWIPPDGQAGYYIYMHFAELKELNKNREFIIELNNERWINETISPTYLRSVTKFNRTSLKGIQLEFRIYATNDSNLPPLLNAVEFYKVREFTQLPTQRDDVEAVMNIKKFYMITKHWQGDPCLPDENYMWDGLNCSYNGDNSPRITMLNLSSSGIAGVIAEPLSKLSSLQHLDLSNNRMNGTIPEFLCQMTSLKILNLRGNNLTGSVPQVLTEKFKNRTLLLSLDDNPELCSTLSCTKEKKNKDTNKKLIVVGAVSAAVATAISLSMVLSVALAFSWKYNRTRDGGENANGTYKDDIIAQSQNIPIKDAVSQGQTANLLDVPARDGLPDDVQIAEARSQGHTMNLLDVVADDGLPDDVQIAETTSKGQTVNLLDMDTRDGLPDDVQIAEATPQGQTVNSLDVAASDDLPNDVHIDEATPQGQTVNLMDVVSRDGLPDDDQIAESTSQGQTVNSLDVAARDGLTDESYTPGSSSLMTDQELGKRSSILKKNIVKGQGHRRQTQSSYKSRLVNLLDVVADDGLPDDVQIAEATPQGQTVNSLDVAASDDLPNDVQIDGQTMNSLGVVARDGLTGESYTPGSSPPMIDQELGKRSTILKKNIVKGQGQRRQTQSSYKSRLVNLLDVVADDGLPDDVQIAGQTVNSLDVAASDDLPDDVQIDESTSQGQTVNSLDVAARDGLTDESYTPGSFPPMIDQELGKRSSTLKKNIVKGQGQRRQTQSSIKSTLVNLMDVVADDGLPDDVQIAEATSQGQTVNSLDVAASDDLPDDVQIDGQTMNSLGVAARDGLTGESYTPSSSPPMIDQELGKRSSILKKNIVKGQGQQRQTQSSYKSTLVNLLDVVGDDGLPDDVQIAEATSQGQTVNSLDVAASDDLPDDVQIYESTSQGQTANSLYVAARDGLTDESYTPGSFPPMNDKELGKRSSTLKKNIVKGQGKRRQTQSSYKSTLVNSLDMVADDGLLDDVQIAEATSQGQIVNSLDVAASDDLPDDVQIDESTSQGQTVNSLDVAARDGLTDESYTPGIIPPIIDQELGKRSSTLKKNIFKGQGKRRQTQSSYKSTLVNSLDVVANDGLPDDVQIAEATSQGQTVNSLDVVASDDLPDDVQIDESTSQGQTVNSLDVAARDGLTDESYTPGSFPPMTDQELGQRSSTLKKNIVKGQGKRRQTKSSYESRLVNLLDVVADDGLPDDVQIAGQTVNSLDVAASDDLPDDVQIYESTSQGETMNSLDVAARDGLTDESYTSGNFPPMIDQELGNRSSTLKKNIVKGQGKRRQTQSSYKSKLVNSLDVVADDGFPDDVQIAEAMSQGQTVNSLDVAASDDLPNDVQIDESTSQGQTVNSLDVATRDGLTDESYIPGSLPPTIDQELGKRSSILKKNIVKGQGQRRHTQSSYKSALVNLLDVVADDGLPDDVQIAEASSHSRTLNLLDVVARGGLPDGIQIAEATSQGQTLNLLHVAIRGGLPDDVQLSEATSQGQTMNLLHVATRDGLPDDVQITEATSLVKNMNLLDVAARDGLMDESYPPGSLRSTIDQDLQEKSSILNKNFFKVQGQRRRMQSAYQSTPVNLVDVAAHDGLPDDVQITEATSQGQTMNLLDVATCDGLPDEVQIADATSQGQNMNLLDVAVRDSLSDDVHVDEVASQGHTVNLLDMVARDGLPEDVKITEATSQGQTMNLLDMAARDGLMDKRYPPSNLCTTIDQELWERSSVLKKNFVESQGQRRQTQSSYQSTLVKLLDVASRDGLPDDVHITEATSQGQTVNLLDVATHDGLPDDVQIAEATSESQTLNLLHVAACDGLSNDVQIAEATSQGQTVNLLDVVRRGGLPDDVWIDGDTSQGQTVNLLDVVADGGLMNERYPPGSLHPTINQELWERSSVVKKNFVKGQGVRRRTQSSYQSTPHTPADYVRAICRDPILLRTLQTHLKALSPDELIDTVGATTRQQEEDQEHDGEHLDDDA